MSSWVRTAWAILGFECLAGLALAAAPDTWEEFARYDNLIVYLKEVPGSDVLAFRGSGTLAAPTAKLLSVVTDAARKTEWLERTKEAKVVEAISPLDHIEYLHVSVPWPLSDRDFVYRIRQIPHPEDRSVEIEVHSVEDPRVPDRSCCVRAQIYSGRFVLQVLGTDGSMGSATRVEAETHADPKGSIPKWIVNLVQKSWPRKTIGQMMTQALRSDVVPSPLILDLLRSPPRDGSPRPRDQQ